MKFSMFEKGMKNREYWNDIFRQVNFPIDEDGNLRCPNKKIVFSHRQNVRSNRYGKQEEVYECEDCSGCPYVSQCKKASGNRTIRMNAELTSIHEEDFNNLESDHGAYLRMNRFI